MLNENPDSSLSLQLLNWQNPNYNAIYMYVLIGSIESDNKLEPEYMMIQFINRSGSDWSYKIDASNTIKGTPE